MSDEKTTEETLDRDKREDGQTPIAAQDSPTPEPARKPKEQAEPGGKPPEHAEPARKPPEHAEPAGESTEQAEPAREPPERREEAGETSGQAEPARGVGEKKEAAGATADAGQERPRRGPGGPPGTGGRRGMDRDRGREGRPRYRPFYRRKFCKFCSKKFAISYRDSETLRRFITDRGKILPRRITGTCPKHQRQLARAIKQARVLALLPFVEK
jgi:small subunit ribosomal protein S18